jgi:hypothetical protein
MAINRKIDWHSLSFWRPRDTGWIPNIMSINFPYTSGETRDSLTARIPFEKIRRLITWNYYAIRRLIAWNLINLGVAYS